MNNPPADADLIAHRQAIDALDREILVRLNERAAHAKAIGVLKAEWTHLSQPSKMQAMASRYLDLEPMKATQIAYLNDIPMRPEGTATMADIAALPFAKGADGAPVYDASAPLPVAKPASVRR